jgi:hypothetical protein
MLDADFLFGLLFYSEDGGNMFLQKINWLSPDYIALYPRRQNSSQPPLWEPQIQNIYNTDLYKILQNINKSV